MLTPNKEKKEIHLFVNYTRWVFFVFFFLWGTFLSSQERFRRNPPPPDPLPVLHLPNLQSQNLTNGLALSVIRKENLPIINLWLVVRTGESSSPDGSPGLATLTNRMLSKGALNIAAAQLEERVEYIGGYFSHVTFPDYSIMGFSFLEQNLDDALYIISQIILRPAFSRIEIENVKRAIRYEHLANMRDPEYVARWLLLKILFADHPYRKGFYDDDMIRNLTRSEVVSFFSRYFRPNNALLVLLGNLNFPTATRKVSSFLNTWPKGELRYEPVESPNANKKMRVCFIDLPNTNDATIFMGNVIPAATDEDYFPFLVFNQVLGGTPNSRLFMNLRESKGYAYYAFSAIEIFKSCSVFSLKCRVRPEVVYSSVMESLKETERTLKNKISTSELEEAKSYLIGNFPLGIETRERLSMKISENLALELGNEHWNDYYENIMLINSNKVFEAVQDTPLLTPVVVIVGDQKKIIGHLREFREVEIYNDKGILLQKLKWEGEDS